MTKGIAQTRKVRDSLRGTMRGELVKIKYTRTLGAHAWDERELGIIREETERWHFRYFPTNAVFSFLYRSRIDESTLNNIARVDGLTINRSD